MLIDGIIIVYEWGLSHMISSPLPTSSAFFDEKSYLQFINSTSVIRASMDTLLHMYSQ